MQGSFLPKLRYWYSVLMDQDGLNRYSRPPPRTYPVVTASYLRYPKSSDTLPKTAIRKAAREIHERTVQRIAYAAPYRSDIVQARLEVIDVAVSRATLGTDVPPFKVGLDAKKQKSLPVVTNLAAAKALRTAARQTAG